VLKWTDPLSVLKTYTLVAKQWQKACQTDEIWLSFCDFSHIDFGAGLSPVATFREGRRGQIFLPVLQTDCLLLLNCRTKESGVAIRFQRALEVSVDMAAVVLPCGKLVLCGGFSEELGTAESVERRFRDMNGAKDAGIVDLNGIYSHIGTMLQGRAYHSLIYYNETVFALGGAKNTAEKLPISPNLLAEVWKPLPNMHFIHIACSPCLHSGLCYLLGGNTDSCEVFQPIPETFTPLSLVLPEALYGCAAVYAQGQFVILSTSYVTYWKPGQAAMVEINQGEVWSVWSTLRQCIYGNCLFSASCGEVKWFDLSTRTMICGENGGRCGRKGEDLGFQFVQN